MLTKEQSAEVKKQLLEQIESTFPDNRKEEARKQVESMSEEELESVVKRSQNASGSGGCIFCSIAKGDSKSYKIAETDSAVAVLEINPISKGHTLIIPKEHISLDKSEVSMEFAKNIATILKAKLSPKDVEFASLDFQGHGVINLIPVYTNESIKSERHHASKEELEETFSALEEKPAEKPKAKPKIIKKPKAKRIDSKKTWLPKRIP